MNLSATLAAGALLTAASFIMAEAHGDEDRERGHISESDGPQCTDRQAFAFSMRERACSIRSLLSPSLSTASCIRSAVTASNE